MWTHAHWARASREATAAAGAPSAPSAKCKCLGTRTQPARPGARLLRVCPGRVRSQNPQVLQVLLPPRS
eukprot:5808894-Prymnesium_polylepis.1